MFFLYYTLMNETAYSSYSKQNSTWGLYMVDNRGLLDWLIALFDALDAFDGFKSWWIDHMYRIDSVAIESVIIGSLNAVKASVGRTLRNDMGRKEEDEYE